MNKGGDIKRWRELENAVEKLLTLKGYRYWKVSNYRCFKCGQVGNVKAKGMPDFVTWYPRVLFIECKTGKGKLSDEQKEVSCMSKGRFILVRDNVDILIDWFDQNQKEK